MVAEKPLRFAELQLPHLRLRAARQDVYDCDT